MHTGPNISHGTVAIAMLGINFNQDSSCLAVASTNGYRIFNCDPFGQCFNADSLNTSGTGGIAIAEMLFSTSLVAIVGVGDRPSNSPKRLRIVNTKRRSTICELTFPSPVQAIKLNRKRLVAVLEHQIYIYDISCMKLLHTIETSQSFSYTLNAASQLTTADNDTVTPISNRNICDLAPSSDNCYLVYPHSQSSLLSSSTAGDVVVFDTVSLQPVNVIKAHKAPISTLTINNNGSLLATASTKGTIIRVWSLPSGTKIAEFRRGTYHADINYLRFSLDSNFLCAVSSTGTVHVFKMKLFGKLTSSSTTTKPSISRSRESSISSSHLENDSGHGSNSDSSQDHDHDHNDNTNNNNNKKPDTNPTTESHEQTNDISELSPSIPVENLDLILESKKSYSTFSISNFLQKGSNLKKNLNLNNAMDYLPPKLSSILEPERDFAFVKLSSSTSSSSNQNNNSNANNNGNNNTNGKEKIVAALSNSCQHLMIASTDGSFSVCAVNLEKGGECVLVKQYSLL